MTLREQIKALVTTIAGDIKALKTTDNTINTTIGSTASLATTDKTSIVNAINEVNTKAAAGVSTESLNSAVAAKVTEVVGTGEDNEFVTLYTTTRDAE